MKFTRRTALGLAFWGGLAALVTEAEDGDMGLIPRKPTGLPNLALPTMGGKQFWADELCFHGWRIQRNTVSDHCRLLDERDVRQAWGTFEECRAKLDEIKRKRGLPPMHGKAAILLHGLFRTRSSMDKLGEYLKQKGHYTIFNIGYPSTREEIGRHAARLARLVKSLEGIEEINFVAHSMGNIVIRHYLADQTDAKTGRRPDSRIKRFVMLGPPNQGSLAATVAAELSLFEVVAGNAGQQLGRDWSALEGKLATPEFEFAIVAGGLGKPSGYNPLLQSDNDGVVTVESTRLAGAKDFVVVPVLHSFLMDDAKVHEYTLRFLQKGYFVTPARRQEIPA
ncbi:MAG: alpha/beta hydrolase [Pirellulales bacterium]